MEIRALRQQVSRRPRHGRHNRAIRIQQRIEQTRLPHVRCADNRHLRAFAHQTPARGGAEQGADLRLYVANRDADRGWLDEVIALVRKIERGLELRDELEELALNL